MGDGKPSSRGGAFALETQLKELGVGSTGAHYSFNKHTRMMTMASSLRPGPGTSEEEEPWFLTLAQGEGLV